MRLTRRQREVAQLIARGLTNRQMAKQLFISERTVEGHVEHLLNVLGLSSRTQVAAWFVRQQLEAAAEEPAAGQPAGVPVTLLMAELAGFPLASDGSEPWPQRRFSELFSIRVHRYGGFVSRLAATPGRHLAVFPRSAMAMDCALDLHRAVVAVYWAPGSRSTACVALHRAEARPAEDRPPGPEVAECEWLLGLGHAGQTLVSAPVEATLDASSDPRAQLRLAGSYPLGEGAEPVPIYELRDAELAPEAAPPVARDRPTNLPLHLTSFIDREVELAELRELLDQSRLLSLIGPAGVGKTRLALQLAGALMEAFADGVWLVELAHVSDARLVTQAVASVLQVHEVPGIALLETLTGHLSTRRVLLVLDNCEHVVSAGAALVEALLRSCPRLVALATSREPLAVPGERVWRVRPLAHAGAPVTSEVGNLGRYPAMRLFVDRASASQPAFRLTADNTWVVAQISRRLEGIPLAIELAAAWTNIIEVDELLGRLENRFELLTRGPRTAPARHQTLAAAIEWSDQLLSDGERRLFHRLSVFAGAFQLSDLEAVCGDRPGGASFDVLSHLVDKSLVISEGGRYRCLETIRDFGRRQLRSDGELEAIRARHARHLTGIVIAREPGQTAAWLRRLHDVDADVRAALQWSIDSDHELALVLVEALQWFWLYTGHLAEARQWTEALVAVVGDDPASRARALVSSAWAAYSQADIAAGTTRADEAASLAAAVQDDRTLAGARRIQSMLAIAAEDQAAAEEFSAESLALCQRVGDRKEEMLALYTMGLLAGFQGDLAQAQAIFERSLEIRTELGCRDEGNVTLAFLALIALATDRPEDAHAAIEESALAARQLGDRRAAWTLDVAACLAAMEGDPERALSLAAAGHEMHRAAGVRPPVVWTRAIATWMDPAREALGPERADAAWAAGAARSFDEALDLALMTRSTVS